MNFSQEFQDLDNRVTEAFTEKRKQFVEIDFLNTTNFEDFEDFEESLDGCPTTYYNDKNGVEKQAYITKIDSEGIHTIDSEDNTKLKCIGLNDLNGLYYKIELFETIEKHLKLTDIIDKSDRATKLEIANKVFSSWNGELETIIEGIRNHNNQNDLIDYLDLDFQVCEAFEFTFTCEEFLKFIK